MYDFSNNFVTDTYMSDWWAKYWYNIQCNILKHIDKTRIYIQKNEYRVNICIDGYFIYHIPKKYYILNLESLERELFQVNVQDNNTLEKMIHDESEVEQYKYKGDVPVVCANNKKVIVSKFENEKGIVKYVNPVYLKCLKDKIIGNYYLFAGDDKSSIMNIYSESMNLIISVMGVNAHEE